MAAASQVSSAAYAGRGSGAWLTAYNSRRLQVDNTSNSSRPSGRAALKRASWGVSASVVQIVLRTNSGAPMSGKAVNFYLEAGDGILAPSASSTYVGPIQTGFVMATDKKWGGIEGKLK